MGNLKMNRLDGELFGDGNKHYFMDLNVAQNNSHYLAITRSDALADGGFKRSQLIIFEEDFGFFIDALSMLMTRYSYGELRSSR